MKQNKAEKLLAGVLSISLAMGVNVMPAFAAQVQGPPYEDMSRVYLTKNYELANTGTLSPEETFTFTIDPDTVTDASEGIEAADYMPIVGDVTYQQGEAGSANKTRQIEIQLPEYDSVGVYTYIIHEAAGDSAGVTYYGDAILLRVTERLPAASVGTVCSSVSDMRRILLLCCTSLFFQEQHINQEHYNADHDTTIRKIENGKVK